MKLPQVSQEFYALGGGLDLLTPAIALKPGMVIDSQNYEPEISGGYRRIDGYERYDGRTSPTSASYWTLVINQTATINVGDTITGGASGATGKVLGSVGASLILGRVTSTFIPGENLTVAAVVKATASAASYQNSEPDPSKHADYTLLAANDYRADIQTITGSGPIRGVWVYNDTVYAFRDNAGATAGNMWKATTGGWTQVTFGSEISFASGLAAGASLTVGQTINGATSGATAVVKAILLRTGAWSGTGVGTLVVTTVTGTWQNGEAIRQGATAIATSSSTMNAITRAPGGQMEFTNANFTASTSTTKMYGVDGVNPAFEFDGTTYVPIHTGMTTDTPTHLVFHKFCLFLSFKGSVQVSSIGTPYGWTVVTGAAEIGVGDDVTGMLPQGGSNAGSSLAIFTTRRTYILYGSTFGSGGDAKLVTSIYELGYTAFTMQPVSNNTYGITPRGIQSLITTLSYGDFDYASVAHSVLPFLVARRGTETASTSLRAKDQYRIFYSDGTCMVMGLTGDAVSGCMPLNYGKAVRCVVTTTLSTGKEVTYFGSDDGYVYLDNTGTSFDGSAIESWIRLPFNHMKSPQTRKRYRRAIFEVRVVSYSQVSITYDLGYGNPDVNPAQATNQKILIGGGYWDQFTWDSFAWDSKIVTSPSISLEGTEKNISMLFYSNRNQDQSHTISGVTLMFTPQRTER